LELLTGNHFFDKSFEALEGFIRQAAGLVMKANSLGNANRTTAFWTVLFNIQTGSGNVSGTTVDREPPQPASFAEQILVN
jgi:hypothetical protein